MLSVACATAEAATLTTGAPPPPIATERNLSWFRARMASPCTPTATGSPSLPASNVEMPPELPAAVTWPVEPT